MKARISRKIKYLSLVVVIIMTFMSVMVFSNSITGQASDTTDRSKETILTDTKESSVAIPNFSNKFVNEGVADVSEDVAPIVENYPADTKSEESIALFEERLADKNTDVATELSKQIKQYENMLATEASEEEREKIQNLIDTTLQLTMQYQLYKNNYSNNNAFNTYSLASSSASDVGGICNRSNRRFFIFGL